MLDTPDDKTISRLKNRLLQQRQTVEKLKADGHECRDAENEMSKVETALSLLSKH